MDLTGKWEVYKCFVNFDDDFTPIYKLKDEVVNEKVTKANLEEYIPCKSIFEISGTELKMYFVVDSDIDKKIAEANDFTLVKDNLYLIDTEQLVIENDKYYLIDKDSEEDRLEIEYDGKYIKYLLYYLKRI